MKSLIESERSVLMSALTSHVPELEPEPEPSSISASLQFMKFGTVPEDRSAAQYEAQIARYLEDVEQALPEILLEVGSSVIPAPVLIASNPGSRNYKDVQVSLRVEGDAHALDSSDDKELLRHRLPLRPRLYGPQDDPRLPKLIPHYANAITYAASTPSGYARRDIRNGGSFDLDIDEFDLRPHESRIVVEDEAVFLIPRSRKGILEVSWHATASNVDAVASGTLLLNFDGPVLDLLGLSQHQEESS